MRYTILVVLSLMLIDCSQSEWPVIKDVTAINTEIDTLINGWHIAASEANLQEYFKLMDSTFTYIGTDAGENWSKKEFRDFCSPYFEKGNTWTFKALSRNIFVNENATTAWFDEILDTQMGICRGSGVLAKTKNTWRLKHYVLSVAIPNEDMDSVVKIKAENDSVFISNLI